MSKTKKVKPARETGIHKLLRSYMREHGKPVAEPDFFDLIGDEDDSVGAWQSVVETFRAATPAWVRKDFLTLKQRVDLGDQIKAALSSDLQHAQWRLIEAKDLEATAQKQAAFALGLALGRRLAGGAL